MRTENTPMASANGAVSAAMTLNNAPQVRFLLFSRLLRYKTALRAAAESFRTAHPILAL